MGGSYRHQALIDAPVEDVWAVVSDPHPPEWWPDVVDVQIEELLVVEAESGMDPTKLHWRLIALPEGDRRTTSSTPGVGPPAEGYVRAITRWAESADTVG